jgi:hypothetical protein
MAQRLELMVNVTAGPMPCKGSKIDKGGLRFGVSELIGHRLGGVAHQPGLLSTTYQIGLTG